jgi:uncharacterized membrane protein
MKAGARVLALSEGAPTLDPHAFPALAAFLRGYLHEDFISVHGSAEAAAAAFRDDASPEERSAVADELARLTSTRPGRTVAAIARLLHALGGRWTPRSLKDLSALADAIRRA